jgi:diguanylate cyclase
MTNEKNKYLTIFESIHAPVFLLGESGRVDNANQAAMEVLEGVGAPGAEYYGRHDGDRRLPWLAAELDALDSADDGVLQCERKLETTVGARFFQVRMQRMQDVSCKFRGTVVSLNDITEKKRVEDALLEASLRDELTGLFNRRVSTSWSDSANALCGEWG